ncbi:MAG: ABC transporter permease [Halorientalis sp.]
MGAIQFVVNGLLMGSLFAGIAVGFALIWGVVDIINLAHGEMVMLGGYTSYYLVQAIGGGSAVSVPVALATVPIAVAVLFVVGYLLQRVLIRQVTDASLFLTLLITFGISIAIQQLGLQAFTATPRQIPVALSSPSITFAGIIVGKLKLIAFVGTAVLTGLLWVFLQRTRRGRAIRAVAQNPQSAELVGIDVEHTRATTFGLSAAIAGGIGSFLGMILTIQPQMGLTYTLKSFVIVVFGGIGSIVGALVGGLSLGVIEELTAGFIGSTWTLAVSFSLLIVLLVVRPSGLFGQDISNDDSESQTGGGTISLPESLTPVIETIAPHAWKIVGVVAIATALLQQYGPLVESKAWVLLLAIGAFAIVWDFLLDRARQTLSFAHRHSWKLLGVFAIAGVAIQQLGLLDLYWETVVIQLFIFSILALSWDLLGGQTGYPSFGNMAFFGVGAYTSAILLSHGWTGLPLAVLVGALVALVFAAVIGSIVLRLRGGYFAIATLGVLLVATQVATNLDITGSASGLILIGLPAKMFGIPLQTVYYYGLLVTLVAEIAVVYYLLNTRFGYVLNTIRDDEEKATSMGINTTYYKTTAWMIAALFCSVAGALWAPYNAFINPASGLNASWNVELIVMAFVGGTGTVAGPVIGAFGLRTLTLQIESLFPGWQLVVLGLVVIATVIAFPEGIVGQLEETASEMEYYKHGGSAAGENQTDALDTDVRGGDD